MTRREKSPWTSDSPDFTIICIHCVLSLMRIFNSSMCAFIYLFFFFRAIPAACESSQARGQVRAAAATATAMSGPSRICDVHSSWQCWILNPLIEARDWIHILMDTSVLNPLSHKGNFHVCILYGDGFIGPFLPLAISTIKTESLSVPTVKTSTYGW